MGLSEDAQTASSRVQEWGRALAAHVSEPTGPQHNTDSKEVLFRAHGRRPHQQIQKFYNKQDLTFEGNPTICLRHHGAWHHFDGHETWELKKLSGCGPPR
eukprot:1031997-Pyramimonas_sp.AAC.2